MESSGPTAGSEVPGWSTQLDPYGINECLFDVFNAWRRNPVALGSEFAKLAAGLCEVQGQTWRQWCGMPFDDSVPPVRQDERFQDPAWKENPAFDLLKEHYLLYTRWLEDAIYATPGIDDRTRRRAAFWTRQVLNTVAPTNYFWTNPVALQKFFTSGGRSLLEGARNLHKDAQGKNIAMVPDEAYEVGVNLAVTPGQVVFRNELVELIQYAPQTDRTYTVPIVIAAPWINKYYILDLTPAKSLVRFLVGQGFTVFMTSWKNPTADMRSTTLDDYMLKGILQSIEVARDIAGTEQVHAVGYCLGGTMLAALMAWLNHAPKARARMPVVDWSLFTSLVEFSQPGDIEAFITESSVEHLTREMEKTGYLDGDAMGWSFRLLRSNSLIWRYVVHNYMYGEEPPAFDVLHWNCDSTRLPASMHAAYLRDFYLDNKLARPDALTLGDRPINLRRVTQPLYAIGTEQDHISPWKETFKISALVQGPVRYVLSGSGHIVGIVNPPTDPPQRYFRAGESSKQSDPDLWRRGIDRRPGSWWNDWAQWLTERGGSLRKPPALGNAQHRALCPAPGTYVRED